MFILHFIFQSVQYAMFNFYGHYRKQCVTVCLLVYVVVLEMCNRKCNRVQSKLKTKEHFLCTVNYL
jgi:hypothetical protein